MSFGISHINLGCGDNKLPYPWSNFDRDVDITKRLPFVNGAAQMILIEHCLEHVTCPDGFRFMQEAYRCLKPDGVLRICVPVIGRLSHDKAVDIITNHGHLMVFNFPLLKQLLTVAGFRIVEESDRKECDGHWKAIGMEQDNIETLRVEAIK
jgi:predicted SAM-dependent methyltransferase